MRDDTGWMRIVRFVGVVALLCSAGGRPARAAKLVVSNDGVDGAACGPAATPCRSINRAIVNAAAGDTIEVGPGRYSPAEEGGEVGTGCDCMVKVDKAVNIKSRDGAAATLIDASNTMLYAVRLLADGSAMGKKGKGFTVTGSTSAAVEVNGSGVTVAGDVAAGNAMNGIVAEGDRATLADNRVVGNAGVGLGANRLDAIVRRNAALRNGQGGFSILSNGSRSRRFVEEDSPCW